MALRSPETQILNSAIKHHGLCSGEFAPRYVGTDYFAFYHKPCKERKPWLGYSRILHVLIDNQGRIIFNLECLTCGFKDALKTHPFLWLKEEGKEIPYAKIFHFSPLYRQCCRKHWWDDF
ncbi:MAG: hypothetical protein QXR42_05630 [Candidatus Bathyarchaeia archaeon]